MSEVTFFHMTPAIFQSLSEVEQSYWIEQLAGINSVTAGVPIERIREFWFKVENPVITEATTFGGTFRRRGGTKVEYLTGTKRL